MSGEVATGLAWSKTDWSKFTTTLDGIGLAFDNPGSPGEIERAAENYIHALHAAIEEAVPKLRRSGRRKARGWWTNELDEISRSVNELQEASHRGPENQELARTARTARNVRRNAVRAAKQSYTMLKLQQMGPQEV